MIAGIILSAGASRRMGTPKALLKLEGETFLDRLIRLFSAVASPVIVVLGPKADEIRGGIEREAEFVVNPDPERGMLSSLQCGLAAVPRDAVAVMFTPVDHPHVESSTLNDLVRRLDDGAVIVPEYRGKHGHPVLIARPVMEELLALPANAQASDVIHRYRNQTSYVAVSDPAVIGDIDDPADYAGLLAQRTVRP